MYFYSSFDLTLKSDTPLNPLFTEVPPGPSQVNIKRMTSEKLASLSTDKWERTKEIINPSTGHSVLLIHFRKEYVCYEYLHPKVIFLINIKDLTVTYATDHMELLALYISSKILPFIMNLRGYYLLHASCIGIDGKAFAFCAPHAGGKSTVASALVKTSKKAEIISDDILPTFIKDGQFNVIRSSTHTRIWSPVGHDPLFEKYPRLDEHIPKRVMKLRTGNERIWNLSRIYFIKRWDKKISTNSMRLNTAQLKKLLLYQYYETGYSYYMNLHIESSPFIQAIASNVPGYLMFVDEPLSSMEKWACHFWLELSNTFTVPE